MKKTKLLSTLMLMGLVLTGCGEQGAKGDKGDKGDQGVSVVSIVKTNTDGLVDTYTITYSDQHTDTFEVTNGAHGNNGINGVDGNSPTVEINDLNHWVINGVDTLIEATGKTGTSGNNGKSAYEIYCENHPGYNKSEQEWIDEFCKKDLTDYSIYDNFEFSPVTYGGVKGYSASYIGIGGEVEVPDSFNCEPVLGFKFGYNDIHEILEKDLSFKISQISLPSTIKFVGLNGDSEYALYSLSDTLFIFSGSIDEIIYKNYYFENICFDGSFEELQQTNLVEKFPISNIYTKSITDQYELSVNNGDVFNSKYQIISEKVSSLLDFLLPDMTTKFDDGSIQFPNRVSITYDGSGVDIPIKVVVSDGTEACSSNNNTVNYNASKIDQFKGKESFLVEILFELNETYYVGAGSMIVVSKMPNIIKVSNNTYELKEYNEVFQSNVGDKYSQEYTVNLFEGSNEIKTYYENQYGIFETAIPNFESDTDYGCSTDISFDSSNKCIDCKKAGDYLLGFAYFKNSEKYMIRSSDISDISYKIKSVVVETMQKKYICHGNEIYVKDGDSIVFPDSIEFMFGNASYNLPLTVVEEPKNEYISFDGNTISFNIGEEEKVYTSIFYFVDVPGYTRVSFVINFKLNK